MIFNDSVIEEAVYIVQKNKSRYARCRGQICFNEDLKKFKNCFIF